MLCDFPCDNTTCCQEVADLEASLVQQLKDRSFIPKQPGTYCNMSDYVDENSNVSRVGVYNDMTMQTRRSRKMAQDEYIKSLFAAAHSYIDSACSDNVNV
jgi:hypothetical protein